MTKKFTILFSLLVYQIYSQSKPDLKPQQPVIFHVSPIFSPNHFGSQIGLQKLQNQLEIHKKNGRVVLRERFLGLDFSFYSQPYLHNSFSLLANYSFRRTNPHGFYKQIRPFLGISEAILNQESYSVNDKNEAVLNGLTGIFYLTGGTNLELGKVFKSQSMLNDLHIGLMLQSYYPNFRFFALRPSFSLGTSFKINRFQRNFHKKIIQN